MGTKLKNIIFIILLITSFNLFPEEKPQQEETLEELLALGKAGDAEAQYKLGRYYDVYPTIGIEPDPEKMFYWNSKSAAQGFAKGICNLGVCYLNGWGTQDYDKAFELFRIASEKGIPQATQNLGLCYLYGFGTEKDQFKAFKLFEEAANQLKIPEAQFNVGLCYEHGWGVFKSIIDAIEWYKKSAEQGYENAKKKLKNKVLMNSYEEEEKKLFFIFDELD